MGSTRRTRWSAQLENELRKWPLSGVLADIELAPVGRAGFQRASGALALVRRAPGRQRSTLVAAECDTERAGTITSSCARCMARACLPATETRFMVDDTVARLRREVVEPIKKRFVGRDEIVDLMVLAATAGEHLFLHGPPGTAKSALIRQFALAVRASYFEYLLDPVFRAERSLRPDRPGAGSREGTVATVTTRMLPEGEFVFLDELFNANSAILNNLLTVLNERLYRRGAEVHQLPLLSLFAASNHLPEDEALRALFDRFLLRCHVDNLKRDEMPRLLLAGWELEQLGPIESSVSANDLRHLAQQIYRIELTGIAERYADVVSKVRDLGVAFSDRRAVKVLKLVAASAVLCGRPAARVSDFWVFRYVWDREEQVAPLDRARGRRDRAARRRARDAPTGDGPQSRRR